MRITLIHWCTLGALVTAQSTPAYERTTHRKLSEEAVQVSVLEEADGVLKNLGLKGLRDLDQTFPNSNGDSRILLNLFRDGADFEDDDLRPVNHFYDPVANRTLELDVLDTETSPDWALEDTREIFLQDYSLRDARDYLYKALTLAEEDERKQNFGLTFQTLGQVIHHIQDMAQPQHVRLDEHCKTSSCWFFDYPSPGLYSPSLYEAYTDQRRRAGALSYSGYSGVGFDTARSFWHTGESDLMQRRGLADYTNRGFVSIGTGPGHPEFPKPTVSDPWQVDVRELFAGLNPAPPVPAECQDDANPCYMIFLQNHVADSYSAPGRGNPKAATFSIYDQDLKIHNLTVQYILDGGEAYEAPSVYSLNRFNFDEAHAFLIPRAVAYSTGLIDYFFRGRLEVGEVTTRAGANGLELHLTFKNVSTDGIQELDLHGGAIELFYDAADGTRKPMTITSGAGVDSTGIRFGQEREVAALLPDDVSREVLNPFVLVYRGGIGQEPGLAGAVLGAEKFYVSFYDNLGPGYIAQYDTHGNQYGVYGSGARALETRNLAVYAGDRYMVSAYYVHKNAAILAGPFEYSNGLAINSTDLFVANYVGGDESFVHVYTHDGVPRQTFVSNTPAVPYAIEQDISANEARLCVTAQADASLFTLEGNFTTTLVAYPEVDVVWACASAENRHYAYVLKGGVGVVQVYDDAGSFIAEVVLGAGAWRGFGIGASKYHVYVPAFYENTVYVVRRDISGAGADTYSLERVLHLNGPSIYPYDIAVDRAAPEN